MREFLNMTADFSNAFAVQGMKTAGFSFASKNAAEIPSDSRKSFETLVNDARRNSEIRSEPERNVPDSEAKSYEKQEVSEERIARKPETSGQDGKDSSSKAVSEENAENRTEKKSASSKDSPENSGKNQIASEKSLSSGKNGNDSEDFSRISKEKQNSISEISGNGRKISLPESGKNLSSENLNQKLSRKNEEKSSGSESGPEILSNLSGAESFLQQKNEISLISDSFSGSDSDFDLDTDFSLQKKTDRQGKTFSFGKDGKITVNDFRTEENEQKSLKAENRLEIKSVKFDGGNSLEMELSLSESNAQNISQNILSSSSQAAASSGSNFQAMLQNQIQANADSFVKAGNIVLKDNNVGEIKLVLHPESLGNVKIDLHLKDNTISGKIIVQTQEAFEAFKENAESLRNAFASSGFEASGFELSFAGQNRGGNQFSENENQANRIKRLFAYDGGDSVFSDADEILDFSRDYSTNSVNIVA